MKFGEFRVVFCNALCADIYISIDQIRRVESWCASYFICIEMHRSYHKRFGAHILSTRSVVIVYIIWHKI